MLNKLHEILGKHIKNNLRTYFFLFLTFLAGVSAGSFTVNGLSPLQKEELDNYFYGFLKLLDNQTVSSSELIKVSFVQNARIILVLWALGVMIIGIPFIYCIIGIRGFITGFGSGFILKTMGFKGLLFITFTLLPKELVVIPCLICLGVSGINFSLSIIKDRTAKHISRENLKSNFIAYCCVTLLLSSVILAGLTVESYITPIFIRIISPIIAT